MSGPGLYDPTSIMNAGTFQMHLKRQHELSERINGIYLSKTNLQTHFPNVSERVGLSWPFICYRSSIIFTGKTFHLLLPQVLSLSLDR